MAVYFAKNPITGHVKIGKSFMVNGRIKVLSKEIGAQLELLGVIAGSFNEEHNLHLAFSDSRVEGEWFLPTSELLAFIDKNAVMLDELAEITMSEEEEIFTGEIQKALSPEMLNKNQTYSGIARKVGISISTLANIRQNPTKAKFETVKEVMAAAGYNIRISLKKIEVS